MSCNLVNMALTNNVSPGLIVDLGAGSGVVSQQLLQRGIPPERILAIDVSENFYKIFHKQCPKVKLHIGDAVYLPEIIAAHFPSIRLQAIISSLPLRNMPTATIAEIMWNIRNMLIKRGGALIQYTYALWMSCYLERFGFIAVDRHYSLINVPPALIEKYFPEN